jgi:hypothetical protein
MINSSTMQEVDKMTRTILIKIRQKFGSKRNIFKIFKCRHLVKKINDKKTLAKKFHHSTGGDKVLFHKILNDGLTRLKRFENQIVPVVTRPERGPPIYEEEDSSSRTSASMTSSSSLSALS